MLAGVQVPAEVQSSGAGVRGRYEAPGMGAGSSLCKSVACS